MSILDKIINFKTNEKTNCHHYGYIPQIDKRIT